MREIIDFRTAELAKEKGFDEPTKWIYNQWGKLMPEQANARKNSQPSIGDIYFHACNKDDFSRWIYNEFNVFIDPLADDFDNQACYIMKYISNPLKTTDKF